MSPQMCEGAPPKRLRARAVGDRARHQLGGPGDDLAALKRFASVGSQLRLDTDHTNAWPDGCDRGRDPARETTTTDRYEDHREVRQVLRDLEPDRPLAGDDPVVVERRDDRQATSSGDLLG